MIGSGTVATRLLAGTWFGFDLIWTALYIVPMVVVTIDSASRVSVMSGGTGMMSKIRNEIHPALAWFIFIPNMFILFIVSMTQMSVMIDTVYVAAGVGLPPTGETTVGMFVLMLVILSATLFLVLRGGYEKLEKLMTVFLLIILVTFTVVAIKGLTSLSTWVQFAHGLIPSIPQDIKIVGTEKTRSGLMQAMSITGQALPATVVLSYSYFVSNAAYDKNNMKHALWKNIINMGFLWGFFSVIGIIAGATALHSVYTGTGAGELHFSMIDNVAAAGQVISPALPASLGFLAPKIFSLGLFSAAFSTLIPMAFISTYFTLDMFKKNWHYASDNILFKKTLAIYLIVPSIVTLVWKMPSLIKAIVSMTASLFFAPVAFAILLFFINKKTLMKEYRAGFMRNAGLVITFLFTLLAVMLGISKLLLK